MFARVHIRARVCVIGTDYKNGISEGRHASNIFMFSRLVHEVYTFIPSSMDRFVSHIHTSVKIVACFFLCQETKIRNIFAICSFLYAFAIFRFRYVLCLAL